MIFWQKRGATEIYFFVWDPFYPKDEPYFDRHFILLYGILHFLLLFPKSLCFGELDIFLLGGMIISNFTYITNILTLFPFSLLVCDTSLIKGGGSDTLRTPIPSHQVHASSIQSIKFVTLPSPQGRSNLQGRCIHQP